MTRCPLLDAAWKLRLGAGRLRFASPVVAVYNPLDYAWEAHEAYLQRYGKGRKRVVFVGMNPGPFGMVQTGVPFGEISAVRDWLGIEAPLGKLPREHPKRPITGFFCPRSEVSGRRLWGLFADRFGTPARFFAVHLVVNYCPLAFLEDSGRNRTPDKLPLSERSLLFRVCDRHLVAVVKTLRPEWLIGIGDFAAKRAMEVFPDGAPKITRIPHPSPANPEANRDWAGRVTRQLQESGIWG